MGSIKRCTVSVIVCNSQSPSSISNFTERQRTSTVQKRNVWLLSYIDLHAAAKLHTPEESGRLGYPGTGRLGYAGTGRLGYAGTGSMLGLRYTTTLIKFLLTLSN